MSELSGDSPQIKLVNEWNRGFKELNIDIIAKPLHNDFRRFLYPKSVGQPALNKEEWLAEFAKVIAISTELDTTIHSYIEAPGRIILHVTNEAKNKFGINTVREVIFIIHIVADDDGTLKISQLEEFIDSKAHLEMVEAWKALKSNQQ